MLQGRSEKKLEKPVVFSFFGIEQYLRFTNMSSRSQIPKQVWIINENLKSSDGIESVPFLLTEGCELKLPIFRVILKLLFIPFICCLFTELRVNKR